MMRHDRIRDLETEIMQEVCSDVRIEPELMPLDNNLMRNGNNAENARLDVSGIGVWGPFERTFLDIRVMHPHAPSHVDKSIDQVYTPLGKEKKRAYNERMTQMEKGTLTPIVMSTSGSVGNEADRHLKRIAPLIAEKRRESYADVLNYLRKRLRFFLLKSVLIAIRGFRGKRFKENTTPISSISFNLIDFDEVE